MIHITPDTYINLSDATKYTFFGTAGLALASLTTTVATKIFATFFPTYAAGCAAS